MKVCLFDIDGTLLNSGKAGKSAMVDAYLEVTQRSELGQELRLSGKTDRGIFGELFSSADQASNEALWERFIQIYLARLEAYLPKREGRVLDGVVPLLTMLAERDDVLLGLLTGNVERGANLKLTHYKLAHFFSFGGFGDRHPNRDDVARAALKAAQSHHSGTLSPSDVYVIGDTPSDVTCARAINAKAIAVATGVFSGEQLEATSPDLLLGHLNDQKTLTSFLFG